MTDRVLNTPDSAINFILKYIPCIYIASLCIIFLCANDKLVITQKPRCNIENISSSFPMPSQLFYSSQIVKLTHIKYLPYCTWHCAITQYYLYINKRILMEKNKEKEITESHIGQIVVISLFIECFGVAAVFEGSFLNFDLMGKENNVHHSLLRNMFGNPEMLGKT